MADARTVAFNVLYSIETERAYSNIALNNAIKENKLNNIDASFVSALVYGVIERKITLDYIIRQYTKTTPISKIELKTLIILRMGALQLLFMNKVPESAAVNESVKLAKSHRLQKSAGFINAVMRSIIRNNFAYRMPDQSTNQYLSVLYSCPQEIVDNFINDYGRTNAIEILETLNGRPPITLRVNTLKTDIDKLIDKLNEEKVKVEKVKYIDNALFVSDTGNIERLQSFIDGDFHIQDVASQICVATLNPKPDQTVLDVCAAPGGKTLTIAEYMGNKGEIYACDIYDHKLKLIKASANRLGISIVKTYRRDASSRTLKLPMADCVICDVPCSGLGILRRKPEIRYKEDLFTEELPKIQYDILDVNSKFVKAGGILVYSTCTLRKSENNVNADRFLSEHPDFEPIDIILPNGIVRKIDEPNNQLTLFPQIGGYDGFFISVFRKKI